MFKRKKAINSIYTMHSIDAFAFGLIGIFIPIYLLTIGYSVSQVLLYYIVQNIVLMLSSFLAGYIGSWIGIQKILIIRFPFLLLFLVLLNSLNLISFPLYLLAIIDGFQSALYWIPLHILFSHYSNKEDIGSSTSKLFAFPQLAGISAPLLGGLIAVFFGFKILFSIAIIIFLFSFIPILYTNQIKNKYNIKFKNAIKLYKKYPRYFYAEILNNMGEETEGIIWPIFVFLTVASIASVGLVGALLPLGSFAVTLMIGKLSDKTSKKRLIKLGAILILIVWILRYMFISEIAIYILALTMGLVSVLFSVPYYSKFYQIAKKETADEFFIFREIPVTIGRIFVFSIALLFVTKLQFLFPIAGIVYLYFLFL